MTKFPLRFGFKYIKLFLDCEEVKAVTTTPLPTTSTLSDPPVDVWDTLDFDIGFEDLHPLITEGN